MSEDLGGIKAEIRYLHDKVDLYHKTVMNLVNPIKSEIDKTSRDVITLKRDRYWLFSISATALSGALYAFIDKFIK